MKSPPGDPGRLIGYALLALAVAALLNTHFTTALASGRNHDYYAYWIAGRALLEGTPLYERENQLRIAAEWDIPGMHFLYPPLSALPFAPGALLPPRLAGRLWVLIQVAVLVVVGRQLAVYWLGDSRGATRAMWLGMGALLLVLYFPTSYIFMSGQVTFITAAILLAALRRLEERRDRTAGLLVATGLWIKPTLAPMLLYLGLKRHWRPLAWAMCFAGIGAVLSLIIFGWSANVANATVIAGVAGHVKTWIGYQSAPAFFTRLLAVEHAPLGQYAHLLPALVIIAQICLMLPTLLLLMRRPWSSLNATGRLAEIGALYAAVVLIGSSSGTHMLFYLTIGLTAVFVHARARAERSSSVDSSVMPWLLGWVAAYSLIGFEYFFRHENALSGVVSVFASSKFFGSVLLLLILWGVIWSDMHGGSRLDSVARGAD